MYVGYFSTSSSLPTSSSEFPTTALLTFCPPVGWANFALHAKAMINSGFKSDRAASVDALSRLPFATSLSRSLTLPTGSPGVVVGVEGDWGSGKSTVIQLVLSALRTQDDAGLLRVR